MELNKELKDEREMQEYYKKAISEMLDEIGNVRILIKIYTVVKTHYEILREKEQED